MRHGKNANILTEPSKVSSRFEVVINVEEAPEELADMKFIIAYRTTDVITPKIGPIIKNIGSFRLCFVCLCIITNLPLLD